MSNNIDYSLLDTKDSIKQALHHCSKIDSLYKSHRLSVLNINPDYELNKLESNLCDEMLFVWLEYENIKRQLNILNEKFI